MIDVAYTYLDTSNDRLLRVHHVLSQNRIFFNNVTLGPGFYELIIRDTFNKELSGSDASASGRHDEAHSPADEPSHNPDMHVEDGMYLCCVLPSRHVWSRHCLLLLICPPPLCVIDESNPFAGTGSARDSSDTVICQSYHASIMIHERRDSLTLAPAHPLSHSGLDSSHGMRCLHIECVPHPASQVRCAVLIIFIIKMHPCHQRTRICWLRSQPRQLPLQLKWQALRVNLESPIAPQSVSRYRFTWTIPPMEVRRAAQCCISHVIRAHSFDRMAIAVTGPDGQPVKGRILLSNDRFISSNSVGSRKRPRFSVFT